MMGKELITRVVWVLQLALPAIVSFKANASDEYFDKKFIIQLHNQTKVNLDTKRVNRMSLMAGPGQRVSDRDGMTDPIPAKFTDEVIIPILYEKTSQQLELTTPGYGYATFEIPLTLSLQYHNATCPDGKYNRRYREYKIATIKNDGVETRNYEVLPPSENEPTSIPLKVTTKYEKNDTGELLINISVADSASKSEENVMNKGDSWDLGRIKSEITAKAKDKKIPERLFGPGEVSEIADLICNKFYYADFFKNKNSNSLDVQLTIFEDNINYTITISWSYSDLYGDYKKEMPTGKAAFACRKNYNTGGSISNWSIEFWSLDVKNKKEKPTTAD